MIQRKSVYSAWDFEFDSLACTHSLLVLIMNWNGGKLFMSTDWQYLPVKLIGSMYLKQNWDEWVWKEFRIGKEAGSLSIQLLKLLPSFEAWKFWEIATILWGMGILEIISYEKGSEFILECFTRALSRQ